MRVRDPPRAPERLDDPDPGFPIGGPRRLSLITSPVVRAGSYPSPGRVWGLSSDQTGKCASGVWRERVRKLRGESVHDQFDVTLEDQDLLREVELTTNLIIAASETEEHLSLDEIDQILGVVPRRSAS